MAGVLGMPYIAQSDSISMWCPQEAYLPDVQCFMYCSEHYEVAFTPSNECVFECSGKSEGRAVVEVLCIHYIAIKSFLLPVVTKNNVYSEDEVVWG